MSKAVDEMSVKELKAMITEAGLQFTDCVEKRDLQARAREAQITIMAAAAEDSDPLFADLVTGPGCRIVKTECRALSLIQFQKIIDHITRRLTENEEIWQVDSYETGVKSQVDLTDPLAVNLYHTCKQVIIPGTIKQQLSLVELMAEGDQIGDYFTSHWWGEPIVEMFSCLTQVSLDRGLQDKDSKDYLDGRVPCFWICAYANNRP